MGLIKLLKKANRMDLTTGLRHRTLSAEEIKKAELGVCEGEEKHQIEYISIGEKFQIVKNICSLKTTRDVSHHEEFHTGFYLDKRITSTYNLQGQLEERYVEHFYNVFPPELGNNFRVVFNPPGRIIGEIVGEW